MRKLTAMLMVAMMAASLQAQSPHRMSYQAVIRDAAGHLVINHAIGLKASILQGTPTGFPVYSEILTPTTNENGLISVELGGENGFWDIKWEAGPYFLKTEIDPTGGRGYTITGTTQLLSVPYALHAQTADRATYAVQEYDPVFGDWDRSSGISVTESQISDLKDYEPAFGKATAFNKNFGITTGTVAQGDDSRISNGQAAFDWGNHATGGYLTGYTENDPVFEAWDKSTGISVKESQITDLQNYEIAFAKSTAFNKNFGNYAGTVAEGNDSRINNGQTAFDWGNHADAGYLTGYTETDPVFDAWDKSTGISVTESQISDFQSYELEFSKLTGFNKDFGTTAGTVAEGNDSRINNGQTAFDWGNHADGGYLTGYTETDPVFGASIAAGITATDTASWNDKSEFDGDFASLHNAPPIANTIDEKSIQLNTNDHTSSLNITKNNGTSVFKVDGSGKMTGDGSGLSNVKPMINYIGGNQNFQITATQSEYNNVRTISLTVPSSGTCFAMASGYVDWESTGWDILRAGILMDLDPNNSYSAENEWYSYLNILTDYNCPDSSDQYTSFSQSRCFPVSAGTHTFTLWANKYSSSSITEVADVNLSVMFFPTGGTGAPEPLARKEEKITITPRKQGSLSGE